MTGSGHVEGSSPSGDGSGDGGGCSRGEIEAETHGPEVISVTKTELRASRRVVPVTCYLRNRHSRPGGGLAALGGSWKLAGWTSH